MQLMKKITFSIFTVLIIVLAIPTRPLALSSKFETSPVSEEVKSGFKVETVESFEMRSLEAFHVDSADGSFAVACAPMRYNSNGYRKEIAVYTSDGTLKYAVAIEIQPSDIALYLDQGVLSVYVKKGSLIFSFNENGEFTGITEWTDQTKEVNDFLSTNVYPRTKKINDVTYTLEDRTIGFEPSFKVLKATYSNGESEILYESKENITLYKDGFIIVFIAIFLISVTSLLIKKIRK